MIFRSLLVGSAALFALNGCVNAAKTVTSSANKSAYSAANTTSASCPGDGALGPEYDTPIEQDAIDQARLDEAIRHFTNKKRCAQGLTPLAGDAGLMKIAAGHSKDMVTMNFFAHDSPVPGKTKYVDRLRGANIPFRAAAENLGQNSRLQIEPGRAFYPVDKAACQFSHDRGGKVLPAHTYRTIASTMVEIWEDSPQHRANMLNPDFRRLGTGGATKANAANCGDVYATQNYAA